jgi:hypothetical protein
MNLIKKQLLNRSTIFVCMFTTFIVHGTIPFLTTPAFQSVLTKQGFAKSFANSQFPYIFANNFGYPTPIPISFGLPAMLLSSLFTRLGLSSADSYTLSSAVFLLIGFLGARQWAKLFFNKNIASVAALLWTSQPIIWYHQEYTSLAIGFVLIPTYCSIVNSFINLRFDNKEKVIKSISLLIFTTVISLFMDGYTFVMFFTFSFLCWLFLSLYRDFYLKKIILIEEVFKKFLALLFSFSIPVILYSIYFPGVSSTSFEMDYYRTGGLDLSFLILPTEGTNFIGDLVGFSTPRSLVEQFGDESVYLSTYSFPLIIFFIFAILVFKKNKNPIILFFIVLSIVSIYLSLGPSLKINSTKPNPQISQLMTEEYALFSTGNEIIYQYLPGFKTMRVTFRWLAMFTFSSWTLVMIFLSSLKFKSKNFLQFIILSLLIISYLPDLPERLNKQVTNRNQLIELEETFVPKVAKQVTSDEVIIFIPMNNDFAANFISSYGNFRTYNVGSDKSLDFASQYWPDRIINIDKEFKDNTSFDIDSVVDNLDKNEIIIVPYFSLYSPQNDYCFIYNYKNILFTPKIDTFSLQCSYDNNLPPELIKKLIQVEESDKFLIYENNSFLSIKLKK